MGKTRIEWTSSDDGAAGYTWNPITGCTQVSPACDPRYAETFSERWRNVPGHYFQHGFDWQLRPGKLTEPLSYPAGARVFVNSMSDLFHTSIPTEYVARVFAVMAARPDVTFMVLTKRHGRIRSLLSSQAFAQAVHLAHHWHGDVPNRLRRRFTWPLGNVWLGVSTETQRWADVRIPALLGTPAAVRFASCEPLLAHLDLTGYLTPAEPGTAGLDWIILGGESGPGARPMDLAWVEELVGQCRAADTPVHVKQLGTRWGRAHHDIARFPTPLQIREWPATRREGVAAA
jgi:protein gp37